MSARGLGDINLGEEVVPSLTQFRHTMELAGFLDAKKTVFRLTPEFHQLRAQSGFREIYPRLFKAHRLELDWSNYRAGRPYTILQAGMLFHLFLFAGFGHEWRAISDYFGFFDRAFPQILGVEGGSPEELRDAYEGSVCINWAVVFGIVDVSEDSESIRATPLLQDVVRFTPEVRQLFSHGLSSGS